MYLGPLLTPCPFLMSWQPKPSRFFRLALCLFCRWLRHMPVLAIFLVTVPHFFTVIINCKSVSSLRRGVCRVAGCAKIIGHHNIAQHRKNKPKDDLTTGVCCVHNKS